MIVNKRKSFISKNIATIAIIFLLSLIVNMLISGCSIFSIVNKAYSGTEEEPPVLPEVEIDEGEVKEISVSEENTKKSYIIENEVSLVDESTRNPFKPFYISDDDEEEENILTLSGISSKDGVEYAEIDFNGYIYNLKENDTLSDFYLVQAINNDSVVLLKGDEIVTMYIGIPVYD